MELKIGAYWIYLFTKARAFGSTRYTGGFVWNKPLLCSEGCFQEFRLLFRTHGPLGRVVGILHEKRGDS